MLEKVEIYVKQIYGKEVVYPANKTAELFLTMQGAKKKTLTPATLAIISELGFEVEVKANEVPATVMDKYKKAA